MIVPAWTLQTIINSINKILPLEERSAPVKYSLIPLTIFASTS